MRKETSYKKAERRLARRTGALIRTSLKAAAEGLAKLLALPSRSFTIVILPEGTRPPQQATFRIGWTLVFLLALTVGAAAIPFLRTGKDATKAQRTTEAEQIKKEMAQQDELRDAVADLLVQTEPLVQELDTIKHTMLPGTAESALYGNTKGWRELLGIDHKQAPASELSKMTELRNALDASSATIVEAGRTVGNVGETVAALPLLWPLKDGIGHISATFGISPNPFTGLPYIHKGLDIGNYRSGDPIVAAADGVVVAAFYDAISGYGNNVILQHQYGYLTRYAHMTKMKVKVGQKVKQGDVIGLLGATGLVTGPHLHYEVHLGPEVLDPLPMIALQTKLSLPRKSLQ